MGSRPMLPVTIGTMLNFDGHCEQITMGKKHPSNENEKIRNKST